MRSQAYVVGVNAQAAAALLAVHGGCAEAAIEAYMDNPQRACEAAGLSEAAMGEVGGSGAAGSQAAAMCIVCYDDVAPGAGHGVPMACGHICCDECWLGLLTARLDDGDVHRAVCPAEGCQLPLPLSAARAVLPADLFERYSRLVGQKVRTGRHVHAPPERTPRCCRARLPPRVTLPVRHPPLHSYHKAATCVICGAPLPAWSAALACTPPPCHNRTPATRQPR